MAPAGISEQYTDAEGCSRQPNFGLLIRFRTRFQRQNRGPNGKSRSPEEERDHAPAFLLLSGRLL
jgi:hypothetical protein